MKHSGTIIRRVQVTEKGTIFQDKQNKYFFEVDPHANKLEIKRAVEDAFGVSVADVNTMHYRGKRKRERTVRYGRRADWKRAVVTLKEGSRIDMT